MRVRLVDTMGNSMYANVPPEFRVYTVAVIPRLSVAWKDELFAASSRTVVHTFRPLALGDSLCTDPTGTPIWGTSWGTDTEDGFLGTLRPSGPQTLDTESFSWHRELDQLAARAKLFPAVHQDGYHTYE